MSLNVGILEHMGQGVHCQIVKLGFGKETLVGNIVVDMYVKYWFEC